MHLYTIVIGTILVQNIDEQGMSDTKVKFKNIKLNGKLKTENPSQNGKLKTESPIQNGKFKTESPLQNGKIKTESSLQNGINKSSNTTNEWKTTVIFPICDSLCR